jgi:hypothetical protein
MSDFIEFFGKLNTHQLRSLIREFNHQDVLKSYFRLNKADLLNAMSQVYSYKNGVISINKTLPKNLLGFLNKSGIKKVRYSQEPINITAGKTEVPKNTDLQTVNLGVNYSKKEAKLASQSVVSETPQTGHRTNKELMDKIANLEKELADTQSIMVEMKQGGKERPPLAKPIKSKGIITGKNVFYERPSKTRGRNDATNMGVRPVEKIPEPVKQVETTPVDDALTIKAEAEVAGKEPDAKPIKIKKESDNDLKIKALQQKLMVNDERIKETVKLNADKSTTKEQRLQIRKAQDALYDNAKRIKDEIDELRFSNVEGSVMF